MIIVTGRLTVAPARRAAYLEGCRAIVAAARETPGCLDFAVTADLLDPGRVVVVERWASTEALASFRGAGPSDDQQDLILDADVAEYDVASSRSLTG